MMKKKVIAGLVLSSLMLGGCASNSTYYVDQENGSCHEAGKPFAGLNYRDFFQCSGRDGAEHVGQPQAAPPKC